MSKEKIDVLIIGGGVAGLASAISLSKNNINTILLEKNSEFGARIKGEIINQNAEIFKKLFDNGLPENVKKIVFKTAKYYTPTLKKHAIRNFPNNIKIGIEYKTLINELLKTSIKQGVDLRNNSEVIEFIIKDKKIIGVKYENLDIIKEIYPRVIICASGLDFFHRISPFIDKPKNIFPVLKLIVDNINIPDPSQLEFFLLSIPGVIYLFPKSMRMAELGVMIWTNMIEKEIDLDFTLNYNLQNNKILKTRLQNHKIIYRCKEEIPMGGPIKKIYYQNIFFIGNVAGHVGAVGGSGIISSMTIGYELGSFLSHLLKEKDELNINDFEDCQRKISKLPIYKWLRQEKSNAKVMREILYKNYKDIDDIDNLWDKFKFMIESRGA
ncbi:MAG: NAD(P)/FAD-dependent oxidoreductase [Candidatus Helarchaeota archaeon]